MHQPGELDGHACVERDDILPVVDVVKHTEGGIDLRVELSDHAREQDHGDTRNEEDGCNPFRKVPEFGAGNRTSREVHHEDNEDYKKLTAHEVAVEVVAFVDQGGDLVGLRVGVLVQFPVNGGESDNRGLSSFHDGQPEDDQPKNDEGNGGVGGYGERGLGGKDQSHDERDRKNQKDRRVGALEGGPEVL